MQPNCTQLLYSTEFLLIEPSRSGSVDNLTKVIGANCASSSYQVRGDVVAFSIKINSGNEHAL